MTARRASRPAVFDVSTADLHDAVQVSGGGDFYRVKSVGGQSLDKTRSKDTNPMPAAIPLAPPINRPTLRRGHTTDSRYPYLSRYDSRDEVERGGSRASYNFQPNAESATNPSEDEKLSARKGWGYQPINFGHLHFPAFKSPSAQLTLLGLVFCFGPGLFCMLNGLGGGGLANPAPSNDALVANNVAIALVGFFAGPIVSKIGFRISLTLGGFGYVLYTSSLLTYQITGNGPFLITSGAVLGVLCSLLWTAQGAMLMSYPLPRYKGRYTSYVWTIFNLGAAGASLVTSGHLKSLTNVGLPYMIDRPSTKSPLLLWKHIQHHLCCCHLSDRPLLLPRHVYLQCQRDRTQRWLSRRPPRKGRLDKRDRQSNAPTQNRHVHHRSLPSLLLLKLLLPLPAQRHQPRRLQRTHARAQQYSVLG